MRNIYIVSWNRFYLFTKLSFSKSSDIKKSLLRQLFNQSTIIKSATHQNLTSNIDTNNIGIPETIYKYRSYEGFGCEHNFGTQALTEFKLYASSAKHFNDPFDNAMPFLYTEESFTLDLFTQEYLRDHPFPGKRPYIDLLIDAKERYNYIKTYPKKHWWENNDTINQMDNEFYGILSLTKKRQPVDVESLKSFLVKE